MRCFMREIEEKEYDGYCPDCWNYTKGHLILTHVKTVVAGVPVEANIHKLVCDTCGAYMNNDIIDREHDIVVYNEYKKKVGLLTTDEIKQIRQKRGWSQRQMAKFLDIGEKDITRYENGSVQTRCIDNLIRLVGDDEVFEEMCRCLHKTYLSKNK